MAPLSLKIVLDEGAVTRTLMFDTTTNILQAHAIVREKILTLDPDKEYGFFLTSADSECSGIWLNENRPLEYYMLRDGDSLLYLPKLRNLKIRMLDGSVKTLQIDESQRIEDLMAVICEKIGTSNYEEYGLCHEETKPDEETKPVTGTLTLKRKTIQREKDAQLQEMSKKLKTDDNVEWLDHNKTLRELKVDPKETLLFKRRLFYSDRNIDSRDPVQLNLLYVQTREAILDGRQVVTEDKAVEFAGIQCQVQYGDFQEDKHKPGFIENLKEFLPEQYTCAWGVEKKIFNIHGKYHGLSQIEAKHLYTKTARELPTYGVTFFLVKEQQKGKKKLVPRLLGINSESILRLDEETKEILQVWLLTQVKSYTAGSESFSLNFGDYSDRNYVVKTNEAIRIKDILEGYIDIIRKKLAAPYNVIPVEGEAICEDMVTSSKGTIIQTVVPSKVENISFVGPSQIISLDQGQHSQQGTQIVSIQQIITSMQGDMSQKATRGEIGMRSNMPPEFKKRLNHLNSESVKTVDLLSNPTMANIQQVRKIVDTMEDGMPGIVKGIKEYAESLHGDGSKRLLEELDELCTYINILITTTGGSDLANPDNLITVQDAARKVADLSTQMCFSMDPQVKKRRTLISQARKSFIQDEKTEASLRRASFIHAADNAYHVVEQAQADLEQAYNGPSLNDDETRRLEHKAFDKMGKLNAAIALLLNAHADPTNIDYEMAVNSMKTITEEIPKLIKDAKSLSTAGDKSSGKVLREQISQLLKRTGTMCKLIGSHDINNMHGEGNSYADLAKKLIYTFGRSYRKPNEQSIHDDEHKIIRLVMEVEEKASVILSAVNELAAIEVNDPRTNDLKAAGVKYVDAVHGLEICAKLTAPSIHEPHCQSALTASIANLTSATQNLAANWKPLIEKTNRHYFSKQLHDYSLDLAKALDNFKEAYSNLNDTKEEVMDTSDVPEPDIQQQRRLRFVASTALARNALTDADTELQKIMKLPATQMKYKANPEAQRMLSDKLAQLNAAIASLLQATDEDSPDYEAAEAAITTISELTPHIIKDSKSMQGGYSENSWKTIIENLKDMLEATRDICDSSEGNNIQDMNNAASKFANASGKLVYVFNPRKRPKKEREIIDLSRNALQDTSQILSNIYALAEAVEGDLGQTLDDAGVKVVDAAQRLLTTAEITAPSIDDKSCQATLLSAIDRLTACTNKLEESWQPVKDMPKHCHALEQLNYDKRCIQTKLDVLRKSCEGVTGITDIITKSKENEDELKKTEKINFIATKSAAKNVMIDADKKLDDMLNMPVNANSKSKSGITSNNADVKKLAQKLADLNAAIAALLISGRQNPDYNIGAKEINNICRLTPDIIKDVEHLHGTTDEKTWKEIVNHLKDLLDATQGICDKSQEDDNAGLNDAATKFANYSRKLTYVCYPRKNPKKEEQIIDLSKSVVQQTSQMLPSIHQLAQSMGNENGKNLNDDRIKISDMIQKLLKTAEITSPNIDDPRCQTVLLSAVDHLSARLRALENTCLPVIKSPENQAIGNKLAHDLNSIHVALDKLRDACLESSENNDSVYNDDWEKKKLKFITTKTGAKNSLINADKKLDDIIKQSTSKTMHGKINKTRPDVENHITKKLSELNAAVATLLQTTYDRENPDYENAETSIHNISKLMPDIIKEMEYVPGNVDENSWNKIADELKSMLEAIKDVCDGSEDVTDINDAASKFANSSGKLVYLFNPRKTSKAEKQIIDLSRSAVEQTSQMLSNIYQFEEVIENEDGLKLDDAGVKVVDVAQLLLKTAEVTAPTVEDARCQKALISAIEHLSDHLRALENTWTPLVQSPQNRQTGNHFDHDLKLIQNALDKLKNACLNSSDDDTAYNEETEKKRIHFITKKLTAEQSLTDADKKLDDILKQSLTKSSNGDMNRNNTDFHINVSDKLAKLNAAIATLVQATSGRENPHYEKGEIAINTINEVIPDIVKEMERSYGRANDKSLKNMIEELKVLLEATRDVCDSKGDKELYDASSKFANASGKLIFILNPRKTTTKEQQIAELSRSATEHTSQLLSHIYQLVETTENYESKKLDEAGVKVVEFSQQLLTTAELTAPSIADTDCRAALLSAIDRLAENLQVLENTWNPIVEAAEYRQTGDQLNAGLKSVQFSLSKLRKVCLDESGDDEDKEVQFRRFLSTVGGAKKTMLKAENDLKNSKTVPLKSIDKTEVPEMKRSLAQRLARLNASLASLIQSTSDHNKADYNTATRSIYTISKLTPDIIKDAHSIKITIDQNSWKTIEDNLHNIVHTTQKICEHIEENNPKEANEAAYRCASKVGRLSHMFAPPVSTRKENQIMDLSRATAVQTSLMLSDVYQFANKIGGDKGKTLNNVRVKVDNASQMLKRTAEILAPTINDSYCQETLVSSVNSLHKICDELKSVWGPLVQAPQHHQTGAKLDDKLKHVHVTIDELKKACLQSDESGVATSCHPNINVKAAKEKIKHAEKFFDEDKMVELRTNENQNKESGAAHKPVLTQRTQISEKLSSLNEAMTFILQSMLDPKNIYIQDVEKSVEAVANLTPEIVKETIVLQRNVDDKSRQILFEETKALCTTSQAMCDAIDKCNMEDLNSAATQYAQSSRKLRYIISPRTYPNKEKKILDISRSVCERVSLMLSRVSRLAQNIEQEKGIELDTSGAKVATAAQVFLSTAQITAPCMNEKNSQTALTLSAHTLSKHAQDLKEIWMPVALRPKHKAIQEQLDRDMHLFKSEIEKLKEACHDDKAKSTLTEHLRTADQQQTSIKSKPKQSEVENIDNLLENIQKNVSVGKTHDKDKNIERLVIEDNPLRQLASKILDSIKANINPKDISTNEQRERLAFSKELEGAIKYFDIANAKCRKKPLDTTKRQDFENAVINLQHTCLLSRRKNGDQSNIVDVMDYLNDVISSADDLNKTASEMKIHHGQETLTDIANTCSTIQKNANKLLYREEEQMDGNIIDDMLRFHQFVKDSDSKLIAMDSAFSRINDENARRVVKDKLESLSNCCDSLRFATKSSISSATSAILDESLQNLQDVERKIAIILKPTETIEYGIDQIENKSSVQIEQTKLATVVAAGDENQLPKALVQYAVQMRGLGADDKKYRLKDHLQKLLDLLKTKTVTTSRRVATWQDVNDAENVAAIENIFEELKNFAHDVSKSQEQSRKGSPSPVEIIKDDDVKNLLTPNTATEKGEKEVLCNKFYQQLHKLNAMSGTIALSLHKPESLSRTLHTTAETASHLAAIARGLKSEDLVKNKRIDEAIQEMNIATYNLLKTSESNCHSPNDLNSRRRLLESCRLLNEAISKLAHATAEDKTKNDCDEMNRNLQLQQIFIQADSPACGLNFPECLDALNNQNDVIQKLKVKTPMSRAEVNTSLRYVTSAVCNSAEFAAQTAYLLSIPDAEKIVAKQGPVDLLRLYKLVDSVESTCMQIICAGPGEESTELRNSLRNHVQQLQESITESSAKVKEDNKHPLIINAEELKSSLKAIQDGICLPAIKEEDFILKTMKYIDDIRKINNIISKTPQPAIDKDPKKTKMATEVIDNTKSLITSTSLMVKKASYSDEEPMTWVTFGSEDVIKAFEALITCIREKGVQAGVLESSKSKEEQDGPAKSYVQTQVDLANSWLRRSTSKENEKAAGLKAVEHIVNLSEQMCEDLIGSEKDEMKNIIVETKELLDDCTVKYNNAKAKLLMERLKELHKMLEKGVVTRVVEDFLVENPLADLDTVVHSEKDMKKRKFLLEKKIAELLVQLGRVKKTAKFVADTGSGPRHELAQITDQVELLAPALVKMAQKRIDSPDDKDTVEHYEKLLHKYAESLSKVRELCDQAVDPIDFAQAAGETMHRIKEESAISNDPHKTVHTSKLILRLGDRVVKAGMKSTLVQQDPELKTTLAKIEQTVSSKYADTKRTDWHDVMAEIMRKTREVESALGGENIFLKKVEPDQPIYAAALDLHAAVREWSARDNEIVAVAKRMAVLMARLSDYMSTENKSALLHTSKAIVSESREVASLAKKLALECTDIRIRTNLLQVCERIPTISGQLKMLTTVKGASFGQGNKEDKEAMNMLVGNAQNLMISTVGMAFAAQFILSQCHPRKIMVQEVIKATASASVQIMSQRGRRMKWVRRSYYY